MCAGAIQCSAVRGIVKTSPEGMADVERVIDPARDLECGDIPDWPQHEQRPRSV